MSIFFLVQKLRLLLLVSKLETTPDGNYGHQGFRVQKSVPGNDLSFSRKLRQSCVILDCDFRNISYGKSASDCS